MKCSRVIFAPRKASPGPLVLTAYLTPPQLKVRAFVKTRSSRQNLFERRRLEPQRTMGVFKVLRRNREFGVEACDELRKERLGLIDRGDVAQPHLLDQAILQGLIGALDRPLGLRRQRANLLDAQALGH